MASSRRTGTNEQITTYDSAGGKDYSAFSTWETATDTDHVTDTETDVLECYKGHHTDRVVMGGSTNDATYFRIVRVASGEGHSGIPLTDGSIVSFDTGGSKLGMYVNETYSQVQDLVCTYSVNSADTYAAIFLPNKTEIKAIACLVFDCANAGAGDAYGITAQGDPIYIINCLVHNVTNRAFRFTGSGRTGYMYNCTEDSCGTGISIASGYTVNGKNIIYPDGKDVSGTFNETTNTTSTPTYVDSANDDFHLDSSDTVAKGNGTDLSGDGSFAFDDDIDGDTMSDWPIGFDEPQAVVTVPDETLAPTVQLANSGGMIGAVNV